MSVCECGCGHESIRDFLPGHDQKLRAALEKKVGGLLSLRELVKVTEAHINGEVTAEVLAERVQVIFRGVQHIRL